MTVAEVHEVFFGEFRVQSPTLDARRFGVIKFVEDDLHLIDRIF